MNTSRDFNDERTEKETLFSTFVYRKEKENESFQLGEIFGSDRVLGISRSLSIKNQNKSRIDWLKLSS